MQVWMATNKKAIFRNLNWKLRAKTTKKNDLVLLKPIYGWFLTQLTIFSTCNHSSHTANLVPSTGRKKKHWTWREKNWQNNESQWNKCWPKSKFWKWTQEKGICGHCQTIQTYNNWTCGVFVWTWNQYFICCLTSIIYGKNMHSKYYTIHTILL